MIVAEKALAGGRTSGAEAEGGSGAGAGAGRALTAIERALGDPDIQYLIGREVAESGTDRDIMNLSVLSREWSHIGSAVSRSKIDPIYKVYVDSLQKYQEVSGYLRRLERLDYSGPQARIFVDAIFAQGLPSTERVELDRVMHALHNRGDELLIFYGNIDEDTRIPDWADEAEVWDIGEEATVTVGPNLKELRTDDILGSLNLDNAGSLECLSTKWIESVGVLKLPPELIAFYVKSLQSEVDFSKATKLEELSAGTLWRDLKVPECVEFLEIKKLAGDITVRINKGLKGLKTVEIWGELNMEAAESLEVLELGNVRNHARVEIPGGIAEVMMEEIEEGCTVIVGPNVKEFTMSGLGGTLDLSNAKSLEKLNTGEIADGATLEIPARVSAEVNTGNIEAGGRVVIGCDVHKLRTKDIEGEVDLRRATKLQEFHTDDIAEGALVEIPDGIRSAVKIMDINEGATLRIGRHVREVEMDDLYGELDLRNAVRLEELDIEDVIEGTILEVPQEVKARIWLETIERGAVVRIGSNVQKVCTENVKGELDLSAATGLKKVYINNINIGVRLMIPEGVERVALGAIRADAAVHIGGGVREVEADEISGGLDLDQARGLEKLDIGMVGEGGRVSILEGNETAVEIDAIQKEAEVIVGPKVRSFIAGRVGGELNLRMARRLESLQTGAIEISTRLIIPAGVRADVVLGNISYGGMVVIGPDVQRVRGGDIEGMLVLREAQELSELSLGNIKGGTILMVMEGNGTVVRLGDIETGAHVQMGPEVVAIKTGNIEGQLHTRLATKLLALTTGVIGRGRTVTGHRSMATIRTGDILGYLSLGRARHLLALETGSVSLGRTITIPRNVQYLKTGVINGTVSIEGGSSINPRNMRTRLGEGRILEG